MKWPMYSFEKVAEVVTGNTPPRNEPENYGAGVPWVKPPDLDELEPVTCTSEFLSEIGQKKARLLPAGSVMVCCIASVGKVGIAGTTVATNQQINSLIFKPAIEPKFGYYYCRYIPHIFQAHARHAVVPILNKGNFQKIEMPVPAISEQRRIVEILDQADQLRKLRDEADKKAERILPVLFNKMFGNPVTNPMGWNPCSLDDLGKIVTGNTPSREHSEYFGDDLPWARPADLEAELPILKTEQSLSQAGKQVGRVVPTGSVMVCCIGSVGKVGLAGTEMAINQQINAIIPKLGIRSEFVYALCLLLAGTFRSAAAHAILPILNKSRFGQQTAFIPPIELQTKFADQAKAIINQHSIRVASANSIDNLFSNLLAQAFHGVLTASWREAHMKELLAEMELQAKYLN